MKRFIRSIRQVTLFAILVSPGFHGMASAGNGDFKRIYIFGDSLSDAGNVYAVTGMTTQPPWPLIPDFAYDIGGFKFTNHKTWAQHFARMMQSNRSGNASLFEPGINGNYAFSGSRAHTGLEDPRSATSQLTLYAADHGSVADSEALYVLQFGGNDVRDALTSADPFGVIATAVATQASIIEQLYDQGARSFLVANSADLGLTPAIRFVGAQAPATMLSELYNSLLENRLQMLENDPLRPEISITRLDIFGIVEVILSNAEEFGIENTTDSCLVFMADKICNKPRIYAFWDGIHPTSTVHRIMGEEAAALFH